MNKKIHLPHNNFKELYPPTSLDKLHKFFMLCLQYKIKRFILALYFILYAYNYLGKTEKYGVSMNKIKSQRNAQD